MASIETRPEAKVRFTQLSEELTNWFRYRLLIDVDYAPERTADQVIEEELERLRLYARNTGRPSDSITQHVAFLSALDRNRPPNDERERILAVWTEREALRKEL